MLALGVLVGGAVGFSLVLGVELPGTSWLVALGLVKLTLLASGGLIAAGAVFQRLARRGEDRGQPHS